MTKPHIHVPPGSRVTEDRPVWIRILAGVGGGVLTIVTPGFFMAGYSGVGVILGVSAISLFCIAGSSTQER